MPLRSLAVPAAALLLAACATPREPTAAGPYSGPPISLATLTTATQILSSDEYEGRAPTTAGEEKTVAYIAERFRKAGLQPGNKGSWFQNVPLVETSATPTALTITGGGAPLVLSHRTDFVANTYQVQPKVELEGQRDRLRRLRHQRARARLERLCRRRRARQDGGHPGQRPGLAGRGPGRPVQRPGDDLLRPLDLQI